MACNCFDEVLSEIKTKVVSDILPADASKESLELNWKNQVIRSDGRANNVMLPLECSYQRTKQSCNAAFGMFLSKNQAKR